MNVIQVKERKLKMARYEVVIHENTGALAATAPYTGSYISKETLRMSAFATAIGGKCGLPAIQVMAILGGAFDAIEALERNSLVRVWTDLGVVCAVITGSLPTADAAFDPERNSLELVLRLGDDIRYALTDTVPAIITDADLTKLRVDNVMDLEEERPMNLIHGKHVFRVAGFNMVLTDEDAAVYLENSMGTTFPLAVDEVVSKQLFKAHTAELLPAGDYKLVVKSRAGDAAGPLQTSFRRVKYLRVVDPEPVPIAQSSDGKVKVMSASGGGEGGAFTPDEDWTLAGEGLWGEFADGRTWILSAPEVSAGGTSYPATFGELAGGVAKVTLDHAPEEPGEYAAELIFSLTNIDPEVDSETLSVPIRLVVA